MEGDMGAPGETPILYMVQSWVKPEGGEAYLRWLQDKHMAEVVAQEGVSWARRVKLDQRDDNGWSGWMLIYGIESREALEAYLASDARLRFWAELEALKDVHYSTRVWGEVDITL
jgi:hypothetical protein